MIEKTTEGNLGFTTMDWSKQIYIPTEIAPVANAPADLEKVGPMKPRRGEAKQESGIGRDILAPAIEKSITDAGSDKFAVIYPRLRELALGGEPPFTGAIDGDALCYTNSENKLDKLTRNALQKRLQRRRTYRGQ